MIATLLPLMPWRAAVAAAIQAQCFNVTWEPSSMARILAMPGTFGWLAMRQCDQDHDAVQPIGLIVGRSILGETEILVMGVIPQARRLGLGCLLLKTLQRMTTGKKIFLEVAIDNVAALALYRKLGFKQVGRRLNYYQRVDGTNVDALILQSLDVSPHDGCDVDACAAAAEEMPLSQRGCQRRGENGAS
ncbi:Ribosomal-protein-S18p-alanine acetyltransferase [invertebrate metagenome]|uniref:Ribosomal-protein-S18p-alanine acetyltransferase n=1 Tax=invertebrate metagenome TaxID=1711999 RepID=A0A484H6H3_9ZZZZ